MLTQNLDNGLSSYTQRKRLAEDQKIDKLFRIKFCVHLPLLGKNIEREKVLLLYLRCRYHDTGDLTVTLAQIH